MLAYLIGTKAQYIKMAPVILESMRQGLDSKVVLTGQHSETFDDLQANYCLPPADLTLVDEGEATDRHSFVKWLWAAWKSAQRQDAHEIWRRASAIVVHGDTASALLGARIAKRHKRPLVHVEAGLRSFNFLHPFPEEIIRVLISKSADLHCCPDEVAIANLRRARARGELLLTQGNTMIDALRYASVAGMRSPDADQVYGVFSLHRHENLFNEGRLNRAMDALHALADIAAIRFVLHPVTRRRLESRGLMRGLAGNPRIELVPRMDFFSFHRLIQNARFVATDGGSNQEECALLGIPCVLLRQATERLDGLNEGVLLAGLELSQITSFARDAITRPRQQRCLPKVSPSEIIVDRLAQLYERPQR